jgi:pSer/pThr/pTyr-binding forkhead associated (FHA) protein
VAVPLTLKVFKGEQLVASKDYDRDIIKIGRLSSAHLCLDDEKVSRIHSVIEVSPDGTLSIIDMGSVEGTFVNGKRVNKGTLSFGDEVKVGNTTIKVEAAGALSVAPTIAPTIAPVADVTSVVTLPPPPPPAIATAPIQIPVQTQPAVQFQAPQPVPQPMAPPPAPVLDEETGAAVRARPRRRKGTGPLGVELRFLWGDQMVGEFFLHPDREKTFRVGGLKGVDFEMGDSKLGGPVFDLVKFGRGGATLRFTSKMQGELQRKFGEEVITLAEAKKRGVASDDGDGFAISLGNDDFAWVDLGDRKSVV